MDVLSKLTLLNPPPSSSSLTNNWESGAFTLYLRTIIPIWHQCACAGLRGDCTTAGSANRMDNNNNSNHNNQSYAISRQQQQQQKYNMHDSITFNAKRVIKKRVKENYLVSLI